MSERRFGGIPWVPISKKLIDGEWVVTGWGWNVSNQSEQLNISMSVVQRDTGGWNGDVRGPDLWNGGRMRLYSDWEPLSIRAMENLEKWLTHVVESGHVDRFVSRCRAADDAVCAQAANIAISDAEFDSRVTDAGRDREQN